MENCLFLLKNDDVLYISNSENVSTTESIIPIDIFYFNW